MAADTEGERRGGATMEEASQEEAGTGDIGLSSVMDQDNIFGPGSQTSRVPE